MKTRQRGITTVEFAIVGLLAMTFLFGCLEFGRALFVWNTLTESTRAGARLAAVCPVNHPSIRNVMLFRGPDGSGSTPGMPDISPANVNLEYLDAAGNPTGAFSSIEYVRTSITGYQLTLNIPAIEPTLTLPPFSTTLPAESLGYVPDTATRECFGS